MAKLINGNGNPAIYAAEDADLIASLAGNVTCIANVGNKYAATEEDATTIRLDDGVIITKEGRRIQLEAGESDTFYIPTGTSGQTNYYIIGYKLVQNADSTQVAEQFVQKMNSSSETITEDTFRSGATEVYVSVYRVTQVGFTIDSISGLLSELLDNASIKDNIDQINSDISRDAITTPSPTISGRTRTYSIPNVAYHKMLFLEIALNQVGNVDSRIITGACQYNIYYKDDSNAFFGRVVVDTNAIRVTTYDTSPSPDTFYFSLNHLISFG